MKSPLLGWSVFVRVLGWLGPRGLAKDVPATNAQLSAGTRALRITGALRPAHIGTDRTFRRRDTTAIPAGWLSSFLRVVTCVCHKWSACSQGQAD